MRLLMQDSNMIAGKVVTHNLDDGAPLSEQMEPKHISCDQKLPSLSARYQWFIAQNLESHNQIIYAPGNPCNYYRSRIDVLHGRRIRACFHGWFILSSHPNIVMWSLWNPLTSKLIRLPPLVHEENDAHTCCLSAPPDDPGSVMLLTTNHVATIVFCRLDRKRKKLKWTEMSYAKQLRSISGVDDCFLESLTCCNGKVYAMTLHFYYRFVIHVDIVVKGQELVISLLPFVELPCVSVNSCPSYNSFYFPYFFLKGSCIELFYIHVGFQDEMKKTIGDVHLFTLNMTSMMWEEVVDLKDAILFLRLAFADDFPFTACYYGSTVDSELQGYVHILDDSGKIIYSFHAKDKTMSMSSMPCSVLESQASAWAMIDWRLEIDLAESNQAEEDKDTQIVIIPAKVDNINFDGTTGESHLLNIPIHILEKIMEHCIGIEYMRFRATSKHCSLAAPLIQWNNKTTLKRLQMYSLVSPWLIVLDNYHGIITFIDPICGERYFMRTPKELKGDYQIYCSKYGWLLMSNLRDGPQLVFFNPLTSKILKLPVIPYLQSFCFSAPPTSHDCMVAGFTTRGQWHVYIYFVSRESTWYLFGLNFRGDPYSFHFPTFKGRDICFVRNNGVVDTFRDVTEDDFSWEINIHIAPRSLCRSPAQYFFSSCDQHLLLVIVGEFGESVEVFKINESTEEWEKIHELGKHMIYVSGTSCICLDAKSPEMGNKIYFSRLLHTEDTKIVFYSLETCRYHTFDNKNIQESFGVSLLGTKHYRYPHTWIEPSWS